ncbi:MAG: hypothetical protein KIT84_02765 [Labilithrix sp.]|nr:hypothetical protein [Labilithrix sp.]MCW5809903.1 hypothetical protein [Labilithrix sp.]
MRVPLVALVFVVGCGGPAAAARPAAAPDDPAAFDRGEDEVLRDLAAIDRRFARRARIEPSEDDLRRVAMAAILHEDPTLAVNDGRIDPFSFDARARGLDAVKQKLAKLPPGGAERELVARLVDGESARLEEERAIPRSASALVRAIVETWSAPKDEREAAEDDRWLARRLGELTAAMTEAADPARALDVVRARELDDALDALEHIASAPGFVETTKALVRMRDALEEIASKPAAKAARDWEVVARRLRAQVGVTASPEELSAAFAALEAELRAKAEPAVKAAGLGRDALGDALDEQLFVQGACVDAVPGSRVRSMAAPREREPACHLRKLAAGVDQALALAAMHDHVVVAAWALDVARGAGAIADVEAKHRLLVPVLPDTLGRLERIALARPATAIGAGVAVRILAAGDPAARAKAWSALGDVPLDIAERELAK